MITRLIYMSNLGFILTLPSRPGYAHGAIGSLRVEIAADPMVGIVSANIAIVGMWFNTSLLIYLHSTLSITPAIVTGGGTGNHAEQKEEEDEEERRGANDEQERGNHRSTTATTAREDAQPSTREPALGSPLLPAIFPPPTRSSLLDASWRMPPPVFRWPSFLCAMLGIAASAVCFAVGAGIPYVHYEMNGLIGTLERSELDAGPTFGAVKDLDLIHYIQQAPCNTEPSHRPTEVFTTALYVILVLVAPLVTLLMWLAMWFSTCSPACWHGPVGGWLRCFRLAAPLACCFISIDLMVISAFAGSLEMDLAVQWIVEDHFGSICNALTAASNQSCVQIQGTVGPGWGWLLSAAVLFGAVYVHTSRYFGLCHIVGPRGIDIDNMIHWEIIKE